MDQRQAHQLVRRGGTDELLRLLRGEEVDRPSVGELAASAFDGTAGRYEQPAPKRLTGDELRERLLRAFRGEQDDDEGQAAGESRGQQTAPLALNDDAGLARAILGPNHGGN